MRLFARIRIVVTRAVTFFCEATEFGEALRPALWSYTGFALASIRLTSAIEPLDASARQPPTPSHKVPRLPSCSVLPVASLSRFPNVAFSRATPSGLRRTRSMYRAFTVSSSACI